MSRESKEKKDFTSTPSVEDQPHDPGQRVGESLPAIPGEKAIGTTVT
jgi:hypothetical protein